MNINPSIYAYPFVGKNSILRRKEILVSKIGELDKRKNDLESERNYLKANIDLIEESRLSEIIEIEDVWKIKDEYMNDYNMLQEEISKIEKNESIFAINEALKEVEEKIEQIINEINAEETRKESAVKRQGAVEQELTQNQDKVVGKNEEYSKVIKYLDTDCNTEKFISSYIDRW